MVRIAALLTVYNRKSQTLAALKSLFNQELFPGLEMDVLLVDDGCTDGTAGAIGQFFPSVKLLRGNGNLYWNGGMRVAFAEAMKESFDYFLWLNDDTNLYPEALIHLYKTSAELGEQAIVVGSTCDPARGTHTYGGLRRLSRWHPLKFGLVPPGESPLSVDTMNGNCVLIPHKVAHGVGNLDAAFIQGIGDIDYGLRARRLGFEVFLSPGYVGTCIRSKKKRAWENPSLPLSERWEKITSVYCLPPREWAVFARRYAGLLWPIYFVLPYIRCILL